MNNLLRFYYRIDNLVLNFFNSKIYKSYSKLFNKNVEILYLLISYLYKKNKYAFYITKQELFKVDIPLNSKINFLTNYLIKKQEYTMFNILNYFKSIDNYLFNLNSPN
jgi:hypothetical protein